MPAAVRLREDYTAADCRRLAAKAKDAKQSRKLLALASVYEGMKRHRAAASAGLDRQALRDCAHRFNAQGPEGLIDRKRTGRKRRLNQDQCAAFASILEDGPDPACDGVVRWRRADLKRVIEERFGVAYAERTISNLLRDLGFVRISARPQAPGQDQQTIQAFKKMPNGPSQRQ